MLRLSSLWFLVVILSILLGVGCKKEDKDPIGNGGTTDNPPRITLFMIDGVMYPDPPTTPYIIKNISAGDTFIVTWEFADEDPNTCNRLWNIREGNPGLNSGQNGLFDDPYPGTLNDIGYLSPLAIPYPGYTVNLDFTITDSVGQTARSGITVVID